MAEFQLNEQQYNYLFENWDAMDAEKQKEVMPYMLDYKRAHDRVGTETREARDKQSKNFMLDVASGVNRTTYGAANVLLQLGQAIAENKGNPEHIAALNKAELALDNWNQENKNATREIRRSIDPRLEENPIGDFAGEVLMTLPLFKNPASFTRSFWQNTVGSGVFSGVMAGSETDDLSSILLHTTIGSAFGAGLTSILHPYSGLRIYAGRKWLQESETGLTKQALEAEKRLKGMLDNPDFVAKANSAGIDIDALREWEGFSLGQLAARNPWIVSLEHSATGTSAIARQQQTLNTIDQMLQVMAAGAGTDTAGAMRAAALAVTKGAQGIRRRASTNFQLSIDDIVRQTDGDLVLRGTPYLDALRSMRTELLAAEDIAAKFPDQLAKHIDFVESVVEPAIVQRGSRRGIFTVFDRRSKKVVGTYTSPEDAHAAAVRINDATGGLTAQETIDILKGHNQVLAGNQKFFESSSVADGAVMNVNRALLNELRGTGSNATIALVNARKAYAHEHARLKRYRDTVLGKALGSDKQLNDILVNPNKLLKKLRTIDDPEQFRAVRDMLNELAPEHLQSVKNALLKDVMIVSRKGAAPQVTIETKIEKLITALQGRSAGSFDVTGKVGWNLFTPGEQQGLIDAARGLRVLLNNYKDVAKDPGTLQQIADVGINAVSRSGEFLTRQLIRVGGKSQTIENLLTDPRARDALADIARNGIGTGKQAAVAMAYLNFALARANAIAEADERNDAQERASLLFQETPPVVR